MSNLDALMAKYASPPPEDAPAQAPPTRFQPTGGALDKLLASAAERRFGLQEPELRGSMLDSAAQGLTASYADEAAAGINGVASSLGGYLGVDLGGDAENFTEGYQIRRDKLRGDYKAYKERQPTAALLSELGAGAATAFVPMGAAMRGASLGTQIGRGAIAGAAGGAVAGYGAGEGGARERGISAGIGGAFGAPLGATLPAAGAMAAAGYRGVMDRVAPNTLTDAGVGRRAQASIYDALERDGMSAAEAGQRAQSFGPDAMLADSSPALRQHADTLVANNRPGSREFLRVPLRERAEGRRGAANDLFDDVLGPQPHMPSLERSLRGRQRQHATESYGAAQRANNGRPVNVSNVLQTIAGDLETPIESLSRGTGTFKDLPEHRVARELMTRLESDGGGQIVDFNQLSRVQQTVYNQARSLMGSADGQQRLAGRQLMRYHDDLISSLDEASDGLYSKARGQYADDAAVVDALDRGRNILKPSQSPQYLAEEAEKMSDPAYEALLASSRDEVRRTMSSSRGDISVIRDLASPGTAVNANLAAILQRQGPTGEAQMSRITDRARGEMEKRATEAVGANSATQPRLADSLNGQQGQIPVTAGATGLTLRGLQIAVNAGTPDINARRARDVAKVIGAQGAERDTLIKLLTGEEIRRNAKLSPKTQALISQLISVRLPLAAGTMIAPSQGRE